MRRRVYSEELPYERLAAPEVTKLLARFDVEPVVAVRPGREGELADLVARLGGDGITISIWPMIEDDKGRWASAHNYGTFIDFARRAFDAASPGGARPVDVLVDLEPLMEEMKNVLSVGPFVAAGEALTASIGARRIPLAHDRARFRAARDAFAELGRDLATRGVGMSAAIVPTVLLDDEGETTWQSMLATPVEGIAWSSASAMLYTSIFEGWSRGLVARKDARALLASGCARAKSRFGERASVSLGCVGTGALGDEPTYRDPAELADDVAIARAAGVDDLALFDLGGVLDRGSPEAWLEAFTATAAASAPPPTTWRAAASLAAGKAATVVARAMMRLGG